ncbi:hypothetical protein ACSVIJ_25865, partial [Pseudomonas sp. NCHU5208]|uniref:hypothetical protein n=1 Tax=unclassified Pseudomonas TaxID=196821 RepID=UPI003F9A04EE
GCVSFAYFSLRISKKSESPEGAKQGVSEYTAAASRTPKNKLASSVSRPACTIPPPSTQKKPGFWGMNPG